MRRSSPGSFRYGLAALAAATTGAVVGACTLCLGFYVQDPRMGPSVLIVVPFVMAFSWPIWMAGASVIGIPGRMVLSEVGLNGRWPLIALGAAAVGLAWAAFNPWDSAAWASGRWLVSAGNTFAGVVSGGVAGYAAGWAGRPQMEAAQ